MAHDLNELQTRLRVAGMSADDVQWLEGLGWSDGAVPPVRSAQEAIEYARREDKLNAAIAELTFPERAESVEGKLAAAIGARIADWRDGGEADED